MQHAFFDRSAETDNQEELNKAALQETARRTLGIARAISVKQVHSARALVVRQTSDLWDSNSSESLPEADALVSSVPDLLLCVYTADCAPVLLFEPEARVCAALHAGWRGALGGIVEETVRSMRTLGAQERRTLAVVGPTIGVSSYPVGEEFLESFLEQSEENRKFFVCEGERWHFDLPAYVRGCLRASGVEEVRSLGAGSGQQGGEKGREKEGEQQGGEQGIAIDTFSDRRFFSHRRSMREGAGERGRNLSVIALVE